MFAKNFEFRRKSRYIRIYFFLFWNGFFRSLITFQFKDNTANAKSVLSVLGACVKCGDEIEFVCEGEDEEEALNSLIQAIENGLGE